MLNFQFPNAEILCSSFLPPTSSNLFSTNGVLPHRRTTSSLLDERHPPSLVDLQHPPSLDELCPPSLGKRCPLSVDKRLPLLTNVFPPTNSSLPQQTAPSLMNGSLIDERVPPSMNGSLPRQTAPLSGVFLKNGILPPLSTNGSHPPLKNSTLPRR